MRPRKEEWLATGDIAEREASGELKFLGRKSEVIVTAAGLNIHPEDIEAAIEEQPEVAACAVVAMDTPTGPEPCAVVACRGSGDCALGAIERANAKLPEFQRISRWLLWPEPDLPRTSTGKVKRKPVAAWLAGVQAAGSTSGNGAAHHANGAFGPSSDWLLALIAQFSGEAPQGVGDEQRLTEDFHLDSLGRVQLAAAIEERLGIVEGNGLLEEVQTLGELRKLVAGGGIGVMEPEEEKDSEQGTAIRDQGRKEPPVAAVPANFNGSPSARSAVNADLAAAPHAAAAANPDDALQVQPESLAAPHRASYIYPTWPWLKPVEWLRVAFIEGAMRPLAWFLAKPRVVLSGKPLPVGPLLIIANHVTSYDGALMVYALPGPLRRRLAIAMSGEMLEGFRHWRNAQRRPADNRFFIFGKPAYWLVTALFNVFPLPRLRDFQRSFAHAGKALDHGYNVLVFPEGTLSPDGKMARFRPGIGLLTKQSFVPVLPVALCGLDELIAGKRSWFRSGKIEVRVGEAIHFGPEEQEAAITARLQAEVGRLAAQ